MTQSINQTIKLKMKLERNCKHSVVYKSFDEIGHDSIRSLYLMNEAFNQLNQPKKIKITIEPTD